MRIWIFFRRKGAGGIVQPTKHALIFKEVLPELWFSIFYEFYMRIKTDFIYFLWFYVQRDGRGHLIDTLPLFWGCVCWYKGATVEQE